MIFFEILAGTLRPLSKAEVAQGTFCLSQSYPEPVEGYSRPVKPYPELVEWYSRPVKPYPEPVEGYSRPVKPYPEPVEGYSEPFEGLFLKNGGAYERSRESKKMEQR